MTVETILVKDIDVCLDFDVVLLVFPTRVSRDSINKVT